MRKGGDVQEVAAEIQMDCGNFNYYMVQSSKYKSPLTIRQSMRRLISHLHKLILQPINKDESCTPPKHNLLITYLTATLYIPLSDLRLQESSQLMKKPFTLADYNAYVKKADEDSRENLKNEKSDGLLNLRKLL